MTNSFCFCCRARTPTKVRCIKKKSGKKVEIGWCEICGSQNSMIKKMEYKPMLINDALKAAIFIYKLPATKATKLNVIMQQLQTKIIMNKHAHNYLGIKGKVELLPQLFTELPCE